jgi:isopentenyldiphosphate isomerase
MAVSIVDIILFNESGELIIQKRAKHKNHNPGLLDKTV